MENQYLIYDLLKPRREDAPKFRRMWAVLRKQERYDYDFRRRLAHDYAVAKCAEADSIVTRLVTEGNTRRGTARSKWPGE